MRFGFHDYFRGPPDREHIAQMFGDVCRLHPTWIDGPGFTDSVIHDLGAQGIRVLVCQGYGGRTIEEWRHQVSYWCGRYKTHANVIAYELGNEPNMPKFNPPDGFTPRQAAQYTVVGYEAAKAAGWTKPLLTAGPARIGGRDAWSRYLREMFKAGIPDELHLAHHPYPEGDRDVIESVEFQIETFRKVLKNRSGHRHLWATETGVGTVDGITEQEQADQLVMIRNVCRRKELDACLVFQFRDDPAASDKYGRFGVTEVDGSPKLAYSALA